MIVSKSYSRGFLIQTQRKFQKPQGWCGFLISLINICGGCFRKIQERPISTVFTEHPRYVGSGMNGCGFLSAALCLSSGALRALALIFHAVVCSGPAAPEPHARPRGAPGTGAKGSELHHPAHSGPGKPLLSGQSSRGSLFCGPHHCPALVLRVVKSHLCHTSVHS